MNDDPSVVDVRVAVSMSYSDLGVKNSTHVCLVDVYDGDGVYIYVRFPIFSVIV